MQNAHAIFAALAEHCSLDLTVIVPQAIKVDTVYDPTGWLRVEKEETTNGYRMIPAPLRDAADYRKGFEPGPLRQLIAAIKPDVIHVFDEPTSHYLRQVAWMRLTAAPDARVLFYGFNNLPVSFRRRMEGIVFWPLLTGGAVANTDALKNCRRDGWLLERIFWGIPTDIFKPMKCATSRTEPLVGYVGRFVPEKGLRVLREALPASVRCQLIGSGPLRSELEGRFEILDPMPPAELAQHLNRFDALVLPSLTTSTWKEQYGRVLVEAMACGVPVIGSDSGAIPEVIGDAGLIVPEGDASALADAIRRVVFDPATHADLTTKALRRAETELSVCVMAQRLAKFYSRVLLSKRIDLRHFIHPFRSAKAALRLASRPVCRYFIRRQFRNIRRDHLDGCWCGGTLQPFRWHSSYGVCARCGCYVNRRPPLAEELYRVYAFDSYWHTRTQFKGHPPIEHRKESDRADGRQYYWMALIERYAPPTGRVVEVGCAHGALLEALKCKGHECIGVEPDERTAMWTRDNVGIDVRVGFFPEVDLPQCEIFLAFDVLEHSRQPEAFVRRVAQLLQPGGVAIVQTPIDRHNYRRPFGPQFHSTFDDVEHCYIFTDKAIGLLAQVAGLKVVNNTEQLKVGHEVCVLRKT